MCGASEPSFGAKDFGKSAVIVAHPGHELMIYHWMERHRPLYFYLTDGSGGQASSRLASTHGLLQKLGVPHGRLYGRYTDKEVYRLLLDRRTDVFVALVEELADALSAAEVDCLAGDAVEGFNPAHDVCRFIIDGVVALVRRRTGRVIRNYDFVLDGPADCCPEPSRAAAHWLRLDDVALKRKVHAALAYPELRGEVCAALGRFGKTAFAVECLRPPTTRRLIEQFEHKAPGYETYGQTRVGQGLYRDVIRYRRHVLPVRAAIEASCH